MIQGNRTKFYPIKIKELPLYHENLYPYPRVEGRCLHLLSDILLLGSMHLYYSREMRLFGLDRASSLGDLLSLLNGTPFEEAFERVFKSIAPHELQSCLHTYGLAILSELAEKQIVIDGKKQRGVSPTTKGNRGLYLLNVWVSENRFCIAQEKVEDKSIDLTDARVSIILQCFGKRSLGNRESTALAFGCNFQGRPMPSKNRRCITKSFGIEKTSITGGFQTERQTKHKKEDIQSDYRSGLSKKDY